MAQLWWRQTRTTKSLLERSSRAAKAWQKYVGSHAFIRMTYITCVYNNIRTFTNEKIHSNKSYHRFIQFK